MKWRFISFLYSHFISPVFMCATFFFFSSSGIGSFREEISHQCQFQRRDWGRPLDSKTYPIYLSFQTERRHVTGTWMPLYICIYPHIIHVEYTSVLISIARVIHVSDMPQRTACTYNSYFFYINFVYNTLGSDISYPMLFAIFRRFEFLSMCEEYLKNK